MILTPEQEEAQKHNREVMALICGEYDPAELQEQAELEDWECEIQRGKRIAATE